ncbi:MAG: hypothetical protein GY751_17180 [Bacteroidetes bacterium]|nr:hypothetical protein [Bacteroidota bacterium]
MAFLEKLKEIEAHLLKIGSVNKNISSSGKFTQLESDLVKDHLRQLYELYDELNAIKDRPAPTEIAAPVAVPEEVKDEVELPAVEAVQPEKAPEVASKPVEQEEAQDQEVEDEESVSLFEKFQSESATKEVNTKSLSDKPLKEIIPLNDKFMFIKEFFDNSISKYDEMLDKVENADKKDSAVDYMKKNVWSDEIFEKNEELIDRFINILDSKFKD